MNEIITINNTDIAVKEYGGKRVVTFKDIDTVHSRPEGTARRSFNTNKKHFIEGEDWYRIQPDEIRTVGITSPNGGIVLTESGYLMLVKSFTDDLAWNVQRQLVNNYFRAKQTPQLSSIELIASIANNAVEMERRQKQLEAKQQEQETRIQSTSEKLDRALGVFTEALAGSDWRSSTNQKINGICKEHSLNYMKVRRNLYAELEQIARCDLAARVSRKQSRMKKAGHKYKDIKAITKIDVIAENPKLKAIFDGIVKKFCAQYA